MRTVVLVSLFVIGVAVAYAVVATRGSAPVASPVGVPVVRNGQPQVARQRPPPQHIPTYECSGGMGTLLLYNVASNICQKIAFNGKEVPTHEGTVEFKEGSMLMTAAWNGANWQLTVSSGGSFPVKPLVSYSNVKQVCKPPFDIGKWAKSVGGVSCGNGVASVAIDKIAPFLHGSAKTSVGQYGGYVTVTTAPSSLAIGLVNGGKDVQAGVLFFVGYTAGPYCPNNDSAAAKFGRLLPGIVPSMTGCEGLPSNNERANQHCVQNKRTTPVQVSLGSNAAVNGDRPCKRRVDGQSCAQTYGPGWNTAPSMSQWCAQADGDCNDELLQNRNLTKIGIAKDVLSVLSSGSQKQLDRRFMVLAAQPSVARLDQPWDDNGSPCTPQNTLKPTRCRTNVGVAPVLSATSTDNPKCDGVTCLKCNTGLYAHWQPGAITMGYGSDGRVQYGRMYQCLPNPCKGANTYVDPETGACRMHCPDGEFDYNGRCHPNYGTAHGTHEKKWHAPGTCAVSHNHCNNGAGYYAFCANKSNGICNISRCCNKDHNEFGVRGTDCGEGTTPDPNFYKSGNFGECDD